MVTFYIVHRLLNDKPLGIFDVLTYFQLLDETINEKHFDCWKRADVYSLGLVYWELARRCQYNGVSQDYQVGKDFLPPSIPIVCLDAVL